MKKLILFNLLTALSFLSFAQHFPPVGTVWKMDYMNENVPFWNPYEPRTTWSIVKDSLIENRLCKKVVHSNLVNLPNALGEVFYYHESNDSVYEYSLYDNKFHFYFWYGAVKGDTLEIEQVKSNDLSFETRTVVVTDIFGYKAFNDSTITYNEYTLQDVNSRSSFYRKKIVDKFFMSHYTRDFNDVGKMSQVMEWSGWIVRCYSDNVQQNVKLGAHAANFNCDYFSYRPLLPPTQVWGRLVYSLSRANSTDRTDFIKVKSTNPATINGRTYLSLTPWLNGTDSMPEGRVQMTTDSIGNILRVNNTDYRVYDFSLNVGDTGIGYCGPFCKPWLALAGQSLVPTTIKPFRYIVTAVYNDKRDSNYHTMPLKMMTVVPLTPTGADTAVYANWRFNGPIYEGVGCLTSLFGEPVGSPAAADTGFLRCYQSDFFFSFLHHKTFDLKLGCEELRTGIPEKISTETSIKLYPNPTTGLIKFDLPAGFTSGEITVYDLAGKRVYESEILTSTPELNLSQVVNGLYFIQLNCSDGHRISGKVMLKR